MEYKNWQFNEFLDNTFFKALRHSAFQKKKKRLYLESTATEIHTAQDWQLKHILHLACHT